MSTTVVNIRELLDASEYDVYIGRPSKWGNRFRIGLDGDHDEVVAKFRHWLLTTPEGLDLLSQVPELTGKRLACWCKPLPCHGDVLAEMADLSATALMNLLRPPVYPSDLP